jgi:hypothetical protein
MTAGSNSRRAIAGQWSGCYTGPPSPFGHWSCSAAVTPPAFLYFCHQRPSVSSPWSASSLVSRMPATATRPRCLVRRLCGQRSGRWLPCLAARSRSDSTQVLLALHYASGVVLVATTGEGPAHLQRLPGIWFDFAMWATVYLAGQVALWSWMRAGSGSSRAIVGAILGLLYGSLLAFLSIVAAGGGHGTIVPLLLSSAPLSVFLYAPSGVSEAMFIVLLLGPPLVWATLGSLVALPGRGTRHKLTQLLVLLHYASGLALLAVRGAELLPLPSFVNIYLIVNVLVWATVYLVGQVALWWRMSRSAPHQPTQSNHAS